MAHHVEQHQDDLVFTSKAACYGAVAYGLLALLLICVFGIA